MIIDRVKYFAIRMRYLIPLTGGFFNALRTIYQIRKDPYSIHTVVYRNVAVRFRGYDEQAIREVLVDKEYSFLTQFLNRVVSPTVLDIGAHIGTFAIWLLSVNPRAKILSVEADPQTYQIALLNVSEQVKKGAQWQILNKAAVGGRNIRVRVSDTGPSMSHRIHPHGKVEVDRVSLMSLIEMAACLQNKVDLAKIDIEGSEESLLCENPMALNRVRALVIEIHPELCDPERVLQLLEEHFDRLYYVECRNSRKPLVFCSRDPHLA